ncbi:MAG TPA: hypothetical protein PKH05_01225, partial [Nitrospira sp.]|nr:hypothetical protein [Nitrospira sp.]
KLNVAEVSAAAAVETKAVAHSVDDKQPATLNTNTLLGVFMVVPPGKSLRLWSNRRASQEHR